MKVSIYACLAIAALTFLISCPVVAADSQTPPDREFSGCTDDRDPGSDPVVLIYKVFGQYVDPIKCFENHDTSMISIQVRKNPSSTIEPYTACYRESPLSKAITCQGSPSSSNTEMFFQWRAYGPISLLKSTDQTVVRVKCTGLGVGTLQLKVATAVSESAGQESRTFTCT